MIVYYNPTTFEIKGMSYKIEPNRADSFFETDDPLAKKIFLGQEKIMKYIAVIIPGGRRGVIKPKPSKTSVVVTVNDRLYKIPQHANNAEVIVNQNKQTKTIKLTILEDSKKWWTTDPSVSSKKLYLVACLGNPYKPLWTKTFEPDTVNEIINYRGTDEFVLYTPNPFYTYLHEVTPI